MRRTGIRRRCGGYLQLELVDKKDDDDMWNRKTQTILMLLVVLLLALTACGDNGQGDEVASDATTAQTDSAAQLSPTPTSGEVDEAPLDAASVAALLRAGKTQ